MSAFELGNNWTADLGGVGNLAISASVFRNDDGGKGDMQQANWVIRDGRRWALSDQL